MVCRSVCFGCNLFNCIELRELVISKLGCYSISVLYFNWCSVISYHLHSAVVLHYWSKLLIVSAFNEYGA